MPRIIAHIDMNCYFAAMEQQANPFLRGKPIGVSGKKHSRSVIAAASAEAKRQGVKTAMPTWKAQKICPELVVIPGDPRRYSYYTKQFLAFFSTFTASVEQFSIDEAFLDLTDVTEDHLGATLIAKQIQEGIPEICGEWVSCSIGIGPNKVIAKLASGHEKPQGLTIIRPKDVIAFLDAAQLGDICGIGRQIERRLNALGVYTIRDLRGLSLGTLEQSFKQYGAWLYNIARGRDSSRVEVKNDEPKSMGHSYTFAKDLTHKTDLHVAFLALSDKVAWRLRRDGYAGTCISAHLRKSDFTSIGGSIRGNIPLNSGEAIAKTAYRLTYTKWRDAGKPPIRLVGVSASGLQKDTHQSLFQNEQKQKRVEGALDALQHRYGEGVWKRASTLSTFFSPRSSGFHYDHEL